MATLTQAQASNITAPTQFVATGVETYAYRRFGRGSAPPLLCLQHFTGRLDFWDPSRIASPCRVRTSRPRSSPRSVRGSAATAGSASRSSAEFTQPCLVVNGVLDQMISVKNSYTLAEHLPRAMLLTYPDAGHGSLFQYHDSFVQQASLFLDSETL